MTDPYRTALPQAMLAIPAYSGKNPTCRKCNYDHLIGSLNKYDPVSDTVLRTCISCGYVWAERPADHSGGNDGR